MERGKYTEVERKREEERVLQRELRQSGWKRQIGRGRWNEGERKRKKESGLVGGWNKEVERERERARERERDRESTTRAFCRMKTESENQ